jgi:putative hemolysin
MRADLITVDPFGDAARRNIRPMKEAIRWVSNGGALICFPAGEVSSLNLFKRRVMDPTWSPHVAAIVRKTQATVLPVWFSGRNSNLFQLLGLLHPRLRTLMLAREMLNKAGRSLRMGIGKPLTWKRLQRFESNEKLSDYLRLSTHFLRNRPDLSKTPRFRITFKRRKGVRQEEIIPPLPQEKIVEELYGLPADALLVEQGDLAVYHARYHQIPHIMQEIGRLREITFRSAQEGTGMSTDLDSFDEYYLHLFLWCKSKQEIVGAYRLGQADKILEQYGREGLYSSTLFRFKPLFLEQLDCALEMGRSFIRQEYQRKPQSLPMLWRGIGEFTVRNPHYSIMFGPVSIGQDYHDYSKGLMIEYLKKNNLDSELSRFVKARTPVKPKIPRGEKKQLKSCLADIDDVSMMISELEKDGRGIPILLRHYLKLSGTLISFNLDRDFSDAIDGLILVDLTKTDPKLLKRFQGEEGYEIFTAYRAAAKAPHEVKPEPTQVSPQDEATSEPTQVSPLQEATPELTQVSPQDEATPELTQVSPLQEATPDLTQVSPQDEAKTDPIPTTPPTQER